MTSRIALAALALGLLAAAPAMAGDREHVGTNGDRGYNHGGDGGDREGPEASTVGDFLNAIGFGGGGPYGGGSAHGPHANGGSCGCQASNGMHAGPT